MNQLVIKGFREEIEKIAREGEEKGVKANSVKESLLNKLRKDSR